MVCFSWSKDGSCGAHGLVLIMHSVVFYDVVKIVVFVGLEVQGMVLVVKILMIMKHGKVVVVVVKDMWLRCNGGNAGTCHCAYGTKCGSHCADCGNGGTWYGGHGGAYDAGDAKCGAKVWDGATRYSGYFKR